MIKAILFDADGMLIKTDMWSVTFSKEFNVPYKKVLPFFQNEFQDCLVGKADLKKEIRPYLKRWKWYKSVDDFLDYWFKSEDKIDKRFIKIIDSLRKKGIKCCLATNQEKYRTLYMRKQMGFANIFDQIYSSAEIGFKKPNLKFFDHIIQDLKLGKEQIQYWDNRKDYIKIGLKAGLQARHYKTFEDFSRQMEVFFQDN